MHFHSCIQTSRKKKEVIYSTTSLPLNEELIHRLWDLQAEDLRNVTGSLENKNYSFEKEVSNQSCYPPKIQRTTTACEHGIGKGML